MAFGADTTLIIRAKEEGVVTTTRKMNGLTTSIRQTWKEGDKACTRITKFGQQTQKTGSAVKGLAMRFVGLQAALGYAQRGFQVLKEWVGDSINKFRSFEKKIAEVSTILSGKAVNAVYGLQAGIENLSKTYGKSADDLAEGTYQILSAAFDASEAMNLLNTATKASIAGLTDVATSVDVFTSILNSYGMTVHQAGEISDQLFQTVVRGKLRFEDLASAMGYITPIAANAGVEFREIAAALSTVTRMGLHVDMATRGLALGIQNIVSPTKQATDAAKKYGVDMSALAVQVDGLEGFIKDLSKAMDEHGSQILPEMIRNMRSLRVFMALAGEEGIAGFTEDLDLLAASGGKTEEALTKMMNATQTEIDILANSMEYLQRRIGEAWSDVDIWWKKSQLWWGTFLSGGDADAAVKSVEDHIQSIEDNYMELLSTQQELSGQKPLFDILLGKQTTSDIFNKITPMFKKLPSIVSDAFDFDIGESIAENVDLEKVGEYFAGEKQLTALGKQYDYLSDTKTVLEEINKELSYDVSGKQRWEQYFFNDDAGFERINTLMKEINMEATKNTMGVSSYGIGDIEAGIKKVTSDIDALKIETEELQGSQATLEPYMNRYVSLFDTASQKINDHKTNLLSLGNAIRGLSRDVEDVYTSLGGHMFTEETGYGAGKMGYAIAVKELETEISRSQTYTNMAMKYGEDYLNEYNTELHDSIMTVYNYTDAQKQLTDTLEEQNNIIKKNNIQMLELQLLGMMRRRGNTRQEELAMKKLQIDNAKARLANMKTQYESEQTETDTAYEEAKDAIEEHYDILKHELFEYKDVRDDEIQDMKDDYDYQKYLLGDYRSKYESEYSKLINTNKLLVGAIDSILPEYLDDFEAMFGTDRETQIENLNSDLDDFIERLDAIGNIDYPGTTPETPETPKEPETPEEPSPPRTYSVAGHNIIQDGRWYKGYVTSTSGTERYISLSKSMVRDYTQAVLNTKYPLGSEIGWKRGTYNVPEPGLYQLHGGETVSPYKTGNQSDGDIQINITNHNNIASNIDAQTIAVAQAEAIHTTLADLRTGKTKYRLR